MNDVFISYARQNAQQAECISRLLERKGLRCWIDKKHIRFARPYDKQITDAIRNSRMLIWLVSQHSIGSDYVKAELLTADACGKSIGPVYLEPLRPASFPAPFDIKFIGVEGIELFHDSIEGELERLVKEVTSLVNSVRRRRLLLRASLAGVLAVALAICVIAFRSRSGRNLILPDLVDSLPASSVLRLVYGSAPPRPIAEVSPPEIYLAMVAARAGEATFTPLSDGAVLHSRVDDYLLIARPFSDGYFYVFQIDSAGALEWLFPHNQSSTFSTGANPVRAGEILQIPSAESESALYLDDTTGIEHVYAVFSAIPWAALEQALADASVPKDPSPVLSVAKLEEPLGLRMRGVGGARKRPELGNGAAATELVRVHEGQKYMVMLGEGESLTAEGSFLAVERWFRHQ